MKQPARRHYLIWLFLIASVSSSTGFFGRKSFGFTGIMRWHTSFVLSHRWTGAGQQNGDDDDKQSIRIAVDYDGDDPPVCALIVMDGFCSYHSGYLVQRAQEIPGVAIVHVLSDYLRTFLEMTETDPEELHKIQARRLPATPQDVQEWKKVLGEDTKLVAVYCESDSGLADAERLRQLLSVEARDDPDCCEARRNKYLMLETVGAAAGLRVAKQKLCKTVQEAREFAQELLLANDKKSERVICKPFRGVASESVHLCSNLDEVESACQNIIATNVFGEATKHDTVLVQEFLSGIEYAVDVVSRDGEHKVAAVWRYDKRPANGAAFCYFKTELVDAEMDENVEAVCSYVKASLDALGIKYGLSHSEAIVMDDGRGPMLVEVNCRQHNMDFCPLTMACIGYNALDLTLIAFLGGDEDWEQFPDLPTLRAHGSMVHLVNYAKGRLKQYHHLQEMSDLPSVFDCEVYEKFLSPGEVIEPTIDIRSDAGWAQLINPDPEALEKDYEQIVSWMPTMFETFQDDD